MTNQRISKYILSNLLATKQPHGLSLIRQLAIHRQLTSNTGHVSQRAQPADSEGHHRQRQQHHFNGGHINERPHKTTTRLQFIEPSGEPTVPAYRILGPDGVLAGEASSLLEPDLSEEKMVEMYTGMVRLNVLDKILFDSQRQGRISFYMTSFGEEATQLGSAGALQADDLVFAQYREAGVILYRKFPLRLVLAQCYGNKEDLSKGRQMPIHYGSRELNFVTVSSPLATQLPQATGSAYAFKRDGSKRVVVCYFGEGAASEGDAHAAMNFASTLSCPVIFFCRNNGYAISTPTSEQFASDGIVHRGLGYGMSAIRVDGNDLFAVYQATKAARRICAEESRPVLIEAMTYRVGHHSTSDDSLAYRSADEVRDWDANDSPIKRVQKYLLSAGLWSDERQRQLEQEARAQVLEALNRAEKTKKPPISSMFEDVYDELPANLRRQRDELRQHLDKYGDKYPIAEHESF